MSSCSSSSPSSSSSISKKEMLFLILQFLEEEKLIESVHRIEQESGIYFNMKYFEEKVVGGEWDEAEKYLSAFTKVEDNTYSMVIHFEIKKQKYLEALHRDDKPTAIEIIGNEMKVFSEFFMYKALSQLLTLENIRENVKYTKYGDAKASRSVMMIELKKLMEANPLFREKLTFPALETSKLNSLITKKVIKNEEI